MAHHRVCALVLSAALAGVAQGQCGQSSVAKADPSGCDGVRTVSLASMEDAAAGNIVQVAQAAGSFTTLVAAVRAAGLDGVLSGPGPFTVLAPTDEAFEALPAGTVQTLLRPENRQLLRTILLAHVVPASVESGAIVKVTSAATVGGQRVEVDVRDGRVIVGGATVIMADVEASNGVIHAIDRVIMPATQDIIGVASDAGSFTTLAAAIKAAGLVEALRGEGPFTVFAPTDEAFAALPAGTVANLLKPENRETLAAVLKYHVVPGRVFADDAAGAGVAATLQGADVRIRIRDGRLMVNDAAVISSDVQATNGVIHVIDRVILPPAR